VHAAAGVRGGGRKVDAGDPGLRPAEASPEHELVAESGRAEVDPAGRKLLDAAAADERAEPRRVPLDLSRDRVRTRQHVRVGPRGFPAGGRAGRVGAGVLAEEDERARVAEVDDGGAVRLGNRPRDRAVERPVDLRRRRVRCDACGPADDAAELPDVDGEQHRVARGRDPVDALAEPELDAA